MECPWLSNIECSECGRKLHVECVKNNDGTYVVYADPCDWCLDKAREDEIDVIDIRWNALKERRED